MSGKFYTFIPHNFGRQKMSDQAINTLDKVSKKTDLVSSLSDMAIAFAQDNKDKRPKVDEKE